MRKLSKKFVEKYKDKTPPWGPVGYITYKRTYSRRIEELNRTEEWYETVERCVNGILNIGGRFTEGEMEKLYDHVFNLRCSFSGRALWQLGTDTVDKIGGDSLQNCWCVKVNDPVKPFCFTFNELMLGGGVGFNILPEYVYELPEIKYNVNIERIDSNDVDFIVSDNREGWVKLLSKVLKAFYYSGKDLSYSTSCIRPRGRSIKSFGGTASGSEDLVKGISKIVSILQSRYRKKLRPIDCLDIMNLIGGIVVAGNVRRSAEIALGSPSDRLFLNAKNWNIQNVPNWRAMSNNSIIVNDTTLLPQDFWDKFKDEGEPIGLFNLDACRSFGRIIDGQDEGRDPRVVGCNPCGEISLESYEPCNLAEIFLPNVKNTEVLTEVVDLMYRVCKTISQLPFIHKETNDVIRRNQRIGIGVSGYMESKFKGNKKVFDDLYVYLKDLDIEYSKKIGVPVSIKLTTIKPSGTLSLLAGVTSGAHLAYAPYYIRRIRMSADDPLVEMCRKKGYHIEPVLNFDGTYDMKVMIVSFPIKAGTANGVFSKKVSAVEQLETLKWLQTYWSDNSVSITIYYRKKEVLEIKKWLEENYSEIKSVSFLLHKEHGFSQPPLEEISKEQYDKMILEVEPITRIEDKEEIELEETLECDGSCPIK
ncbi:MAG: ribonucleoside-triphosphate reductase, adenosylcobalamin-dependent [Candidatus Heimdallarchaeaceae archaeon]